MRILVTGGSGYLGSHVRSYFDADDFSRRSDLDLFNLQDIQKISDYDVVIHLAALLDKSPESDEEVFLHNVEGTINVLKNMKKNSILIFASTKDIYGRFADNHRLVSESCQTIYSGQSALEWSKLIAEKYVSYYANKNQFRSCIFRMSTIYAPMTIGNTPNFVTHFANCYNTGDPIRLPANGKPIRDILHVDDFSKACRAFIESVIRHGVYNIGGGKNNALSLRELVEKMEEVSGYQTSIDEENPLPNPIPMNYVTDLDLIQQELDWKPIISIEDGLKTLF